MISLLYLLVGLFYAIIAWRNRIVAIALLLFLLPTYLLRFSIGPIPSTVLEILLLILFLVWLVQRIARKDGRPLQQLPWRWTTLLILLSAAVAVFVSPDHESALGFFKAYFLEPMLFFLVLWDTITNEKQVRILLMGVGASALLVSLVALEQYLGFLPSLEPWISESPKRVVGVFDFPNAIGLYLAPIIGLFAGFSLMPRMHSDLPRARWFSWGVLGMSLLSLGFAFSRGAVFAVAVGLAFLVLVSTYRKWIVLILALGLVLALATPATRTIVADVVTGTDVSTDVRLVMWQGTARLLQEHPIVGAGLGGFPILYDQYRLIKHTELLLYPHNIVLNFWVEIGLAGLLLFMWLLYDAFRRGVRLLKSTPSPFAKRLLIGTITALIIFVAHGIVDVPYFKNDLAVQFWFLLALVPIAGRLAGTRQNR